MRHVASGGVKAAWLERHWTSVWALTGLCLLLLAWGNRFIQDDAYISFRYALNLASGNGLSWNPGERVEGYTNFLWTSLMAIAFWLRVDPAMFSQLAGLVSSAFTLLFTYRLAHLLLSSASFGLLAVVLTGTNFTFSSYATGGLETQFHTAVVTAAIYLACRLLRDSAGSLISLLQLSVLAALALMTRLDSVVLLALPMVTLSVVLATRAPSRNAKAAVLAGLSLPALALVGTWLGWKWYYYGDIVPNTFYVKVSSGATITKGLLYTYYFFHSYWLVPFLFLALPTLGLLRSSSTSLLRLVIAIQLLWLVYLVSVGGDFMEFRLFVPMLPLLFATITWLLRAAVDRPSLRVALVAMICVGSLQHALVFEGFRGVESINVLQDYLTDENENWIGVGQVLGEVFGQDAPQTIIATTAAGAIPFFAGLETVDMLGLNDAWVARHGLLIGPRPGHRRLATLQYLLDRRVNLIIGHPWVRQASDLHEDPPTLEEWNQRPYAVPIRPRQLPESARMLAIPLGDRFVLTTLYLVTDDRIEAVIERRGLTSFLINGPALQSPPP